jgi:hypothetical protein
MNKEIYLIRGTETESYKEFSVRINNSATELAGKREILKVKLVHTAENPPAVSIIPFRKTKISTISICKEDSEPVRELVSMKGFSGAYGVTEVLPVAYQKNWTDGDKTPGACLLTLFNRRKGIDYETFIHRWHNSHTPLSLKIHPLWNYSRNVIDKILFPGSEQFEGIVEEQMRTDRDLLNPFRFFGSPLVIIPRMIAVYKDTKSFLDYGGIQTYLAREVVVKS